MKRMIIRDSSSNIVAYIDKLMSSKRSRSLNYEHTLNLVTLIDDNLARLIGKIKLFRFKAWILID